MLKTLLFLFSTLVLIHQIESDEEPDQKFLILDQPPFYAPSPFKRGFSERRGNPKLQKHRAIPSRIVVKKRLRLVKTESVTTPVPELPEEIRKPSIGRIPPRKLVVNFRTFTFSPPRAETIDNVRLAETFVTPAPPTTTPTEVKVVSFDLPQEKNQNKGGASPVVLPDWHEKVPKANQDSGVIPRNSSTNIDSAVKIEELPVPSVEVRSEAKHSFKSEANVPVFATDLNYGLRNQEKLKVIGPSSSLVPKLDEAEVIRSVFPGVPLPPPGIQLHPGTIPGINSPVSALEELDSQPASALRGVEEKSVVAAVLSPEGKLYTSVQQEKKFNPGPIVDSKSYLLDTPDSSLYPPAVPENETTVSHLADNYDEQPSPLAVPILVPNLKSLQENEYSPIGPELTLAPYSPVIPENKPHLQTIPQQKYKLVSVLIPILEHPEIKPYPATLPVVTSDLKPYLPAAPESKQLNPAIITGLSSYLRLPEENPNPPPIPDLELVPPVFSDSDPYMNYIPEAIQPYPTISQFQSLPHIQSR